MKSGEDQIILHICFNNLGLLSSPLRMGVYNHKITGFLNYPILCYFFYE